MEITIIRTLIEKASRSLEETTAGLRFLIENMRLLTEKPTGLLIYMEEHI